MSHETSKRVSIYLEPALHRALRRKAGRTNRSLSEIVNDAVRCLVREDRKDLEAFEDRAREPTMSYRALLKDLNTKD